MYPVSPASQLEFDGRTHCLNSHRSRFESNVSPASSVIQQAIPNLHVQSCESSTLERLPNATAWMFREARTKAWKPITSPSWQHAEKLLCAARPSIWMFTYQSIAFYWDSIALFSNHSHKSATRRISECVAGKMIPGPSASTQILPASVETNQAIAREVQIKIYAPKSESIDLQSIHFLEVVSLVPLGSGPSARKLRTGLIRVTCR